MTRIVAVIPARMGSTRFPGKPLALLCGRPMIEHVYRRTAACPILDEIVVATCDAEIADVAKNFGAKTVMTSAAHERATDRVAEACVGDSAEIIVMVQGDEPMVRPGLIGAVVRSLLEEPSLECANLASVIRTEEQLQDRNTIKTAISLSGHALYFSREPIPTMAPHRFVVGTWLKQVCVVAFRRDALLRFPFLSRGPLEAAESIDMLRFLENGIAIRIVQTEIETHAVDTLRDLARVEFLMSANPWYSTGDREH